MFSRVNTKHLDNNYLATQFSRITLVYNVRNVICAIFLAHWEFLHISHKKTRSSEFVEELKSC